jgi:hypothetical protein
VAPGFVVVGGALYVAAFRGFGTLDTTRGCAENDRMEVGKMR